MKRLFKGCSALLLVLTLVVTMLLGTACKKEENKESKEVSKAITLNKDSKKEAAKKEKEKKEESSEEKRYGDVKGFLWEVKKCDATVYMYGSIHVGQKDIYPLEKTVEDAFDSADVVVGEIDLNDTNVMLSLANTLVYTNGDTALDHLSEEGKKKVEEVSKELDFNYNLLLKTKVWYLGSVLSSYQMKKAGYDANYGIDKYFFDKAKDNKEIDELESAKFQFDLLNSFSDEEQERYFVSSMGTIEETKAVLDQLFDIYKQGDEEAMLEALGEEDKNSNYYKKMILDRNKNMTLKIEEYLKTEKTYFVIAGLAHYIGDDGIVRMLEDKGYTVTRK